MEQHLWKTLLQIADRVSDYEGVVDFCCFNAENSEPILINAVPKNTDKSQFVLVKLSEKEQISGFGAILKLDEFCKIKIISSQILTPEAVAFLKLYLPYCFLSQLAKKQKRTVSIAHFAQTLDGKIATSKGDSQWIGNEENLIHAHRMRALCDAIIIGKNTLKNDLPKLTVRRVEGRNPKRVVIGSADNDFTSLMECCADPIIVIGKEVSTQNGQVQYYQLDAVDGKINCKDILRCLYQQGIKTVYIEGGAITTSNFLNDKAIDVLQLHFSPLLFGSGKQAIQLPGIEEVEESIRFNNFSFVSVGDSVMFVGQPN